MTGEAKRCIFCEVENNEGILLHGKFICNDCQEELTTIDVDDPEYDSYKEGIKIVWNFANNREAFEETLDELKEAGLIEEDTCREDKLGRDELRKSEVAKSELAERDLPKGE